MGIMSNENPTGGLPPQFMAKMQVHWSKVQQAFRSMDRDQTGQIDRKEFEELCDRFGCILTNKEMDQVSCCVCLSPAPLTIVLVLLGGIMPVPNGQPHKRRSIHVL